MSNTKKPVDHEVSGTIEKITVITRRVGNVTKRSNQVVVRTESNEQVVAYCSDLVLTSALEAARHEADNTHLRALSRKGNLVTIGYDFNAAGSKYLDGNGKEQVRDKDSNSLRYMNVDDLLVENIDANVSTKLAQADAYAKHLAKMENSTKGAASSLGILRKSAVVEAEPETEQEVNEEAKNVLEKGRKVTA